MVSKDNCFTGSGQHLQRNSFNSDDEYLMYLKQIDHGKISYQDREWMRKYYLKKNNNQPFDYINKKLCYCHRRVEEKQVQNTNSANYGLRFYKCKLELCSFFRWNPLDFHQVLQNS